MKKYLKPEQVADKLGVDTTTVIRWLKSKSLKGFKLVGRWRIEEADVESFIEKQRCQV